MGRTDGLYTDIQRLAINEILKLVAGGDKKKIIRAFDLAEKITPDQYKSAVRFVREKVRDDHPALFMAQRLTSKLAPRCRDRFVECLIINTLLRGIDKRHDLERRTGRLAPTTLLISPTMRCNLSCEGCYAGEYEHQKDLERTLVQRIVNEGNEMGVYLFTFLGGEPFLYPELLDIAGENPHSYFQVFTNGTLLGNRVIQEMAETGNIIPMLSVEGAREDTDRRRGPGIYDTVMNAMDRLGEAGIPFGYSATVTKQNYRMLISDEFVDPLVAKGALIGWHFLYMPIGRDAGVEMMPTPEQREEFRQGLLRIRQTKAMFPVDFWGDAPYVGGCIAGKHYAHITSEGWVEPCIFTHFAVDNIHDMSLLDAFNSPYFREIRSRQPFNDNLLMPCMWIDNPRCSREIMAVTGARPTHDGADVMLTDLQEELDRYSAEVDRVNGPAWHCMQANREAAKEATGR